MKYLKPCTVLLSLNRGMLVTHDPVSPLEEIAHSILEEHIVDPKWVPLGPEDISNCSEDVIGDYADSLTDLWSLILFRKIKNKHDVTRGEYISWLSDVIKLTKISQSSYPAVMTEGYFRDLKKGDVDSEVVQMLSNAIETLEGDAKLGLESLLREVMKS